MKSTNKSLWDLIDELKPNSITDEQKIRFAVKGIEIAIKRLEEIRYQIKSQTTIEFLNQVLALLKE